MKIIIAYSLTYFMWCISLSAFSRGKQKGNSRRDNYGSVTKKRNQPKVRLRFKISSFPFVNNSVGFWLSVAVALKQAQIDEDVDQGVEVCIRSMSGTFAWLLKLSGAGFLKMSL